MLKRKAKKVVNSPKSSDAIKEEVAEFSAQLSNCCVKPNLLHHQAGESLNKVATSLNVFPHLKVKETKIQSFDKTEDHDNTSVERYALATTDAGVNSWTLDNPSESEVNPNVSSSSSLQLLANVNFSI